MRYVFFFIPLVQLFVFFLVFLPSPRCVAQWMFRQSIYILKIQKFVRILQYVSSSKICRHKMEKKTKSNSIFILNFTHRCAAFVQCKRIHRTYVIYIFNVYVSCVRVDSLSLSCSYFYGSLVAIFSSGAVVALCADVYIIIKIFSLHFTHAHPLAFIYGRCFGTRRQKHLFGPQRHRRLRRTHLHLQ